MSTTGQSTTTTIPKWNGDPSTAEAWIYKFTAACTLKTVDGAPCTKVIREEFESELPTDENEALDENIDSDKKKILSLKQNEQVMAMLMIAMNTDQGMSKVMQEMNRSPIFQTGQAWRVIKMIKEECRPEDDIAAMEMETEVAKIKLKKGENPKTLTEKMANIEPNGEFRITRQEGRKAKTKTMSKKQHSLAKMKKMMKTMARQSRLQTINASVTSVERLDTLQETVLRKEVLKRT